MTSKPFRLLSFFLVILMWGGQAYGNDEVHNELKPLLKAINERLGYMHGVALYKWHNDVRIVDTKREIEVLNNVVSLASEAGLDSSSAKAFFRSQITAAKEIQFGWHRAWREGREVPTAEEDAPNLVTEVRPALNHLGAEIITLLVEKNQFYNEVENGLLCELLSEYLDAKFLTANSKLVICKSLRKVKIK